MSKKKRWRVWNATDLCFMSERFAEKHEAGKVKAALEKLHIGFGRPKRLVLSRNTYRHMTKRIVPVKGS